MTGNWNCSKTLEWHSGLPACPECRHTSLRGCYHYSSQENFFIFKAGRKKISLVVYNPYGEIIDAIEDLLKVKQNN